MRSDNARRLTLRRFVCLVVLVCVSNGCGAQHIYQADDLSTGSPRPGQNTPATDWNEVTRHSFLWGLIRQDLPVDNCQDATGQTWGIEEIRLRTTPFYWLASTLTLGLWSPSKVAHRCAKPCPPADEL